MQAFKYFFMLTKQAKELMIDISKCWSLISELAY